MSAALRWLSATSCTHASGRQSYERHVRDEVDDGDHRQDLGRTNTPPGSEVSRRDVESRHQHGCSRHSARACSDDTRPEQDHVHVFLIKSTFVEKCACKAHPALLMLFSKKQVSASPSSSSPSSSSSLLHGISRLRLSFCCLSPSAVVMK